jgi:hypothetical protein
VNIYRMRMYDSDVPNESYAVVESAAEAAKLFTDEFGVSPDFVSKETYGNIKILKEKKDE